MLRRPGRSVECGWETGEVGPLAAGNGEPALGSALALAGGGRVGFVGEKGGQARLLIDERVYGLNKAR